MPYLAIVLVISRNVEGAVHGFQSANLASDYGSEGITDETIKHVLHKAWRVKANDFDGLLKANRRNVPVNGMLSTLWPFDGGFPQQR